MCVFVHIYVLLCTQSKILAKIYEGGSIQETLQLAINNLPGLDTLIVGCASPHTTQGYVLYVCVYIYVEFILSVNAGF
jgi:hypothetical protein